MRWFTGQEGNKRNVHKFLFKPLCIGSECRWLERVTIEQKYKSCYWNGGWKNVRFVD